MDELTQKRLIKGDPSLKYSSMDKSEYLALSKEDKALLMDSFQFEKQLEEALAIDIPTNLADKILLNQRTSKSFDFFSLKPMMSIAASITLAVFIFVSSNTGNISDVTLAHVYHELDHLVDTSGKVDRARIFEEIRQLGLDIPKLPENISYAGLCNLGDKKGMHIVARINNKPVTLFISQESSENNSSFNDSRFHGKVFKSEKGSVIVIGESNDDINLVYQQTRAI